MDKQRQIYESLTQHSPRPSWVFKELKKALAEGYPVNYCPEPGIPLLNRVLRSGAQGWHRDEAKEKEYLTAIVELLLDHGADVNIIAPGGWSSLMLASSFLPACLSEEVFSRIVKKTENIERCPELEQPDNSFVTFIYFGNQSPASYTALYLVANEYVWGSFWDDKDLNTCWKNMRVLLDAGANTEVLKQIKTTPKITEIAHKRHQELKKLVSAHQEQKRQFDPTISNMDWDYEL